MTFLSEKFGEICFTQIWRLEDLKNLSPTKFGELFRQQIWRVLVPIMNLNLISNFEF